MKRGALAVLVLAVLAGLIGAVAGGRGDAEYEATAKLAFIEDTRFDYVDAERDRLIGIVGGVDGQAILARDGLLEVEYVRPDAVTFLDVIVRATSPALAADTANDLAELIVEGDLELRLTPLRAELDVLNAQLTDIDMEIRLLEAEIAKHTATEAFAEANRFEGDAAQLEQLTIELREAQDALFVAVRERNALDTYRLDAETRIAGLEADIAGATAETRLVDPAVPDGSRSDVTASEGAIIGGLAALGLGAVVLAVARTGRTES